MKLKYEEDQIVSDFYDYVTKTYNEHYKANEANSELPLEAFDAWIALGTASGTFRDTALKYLWRYGKKNGNNKDDLLKAMHYIMMVLYVDHYKKEE